MTTAIENSTTKNLSIINSILVSFVAAIAFILSYSALRDVAASNGVSGHLFGVVPLAWLWPLLVDLALIVFALAVVRSALLNESAKWPRFLEWVFIIFTLTFNIIHAKPEPVAYAVAIIPPVALVLSFETLMRMLKSGVRRAEWTKSLVDLDKEIKQKQGTLDRILKTTGDKQTQLADIGQTIKDKSKELADIGQTKVVFVGIDDLTELKGSPDKRRPVVRQMINEGLEDGYIVDTLQISAKTLARDKQALNGSVNGNHGPR